MQSNFLSCPKNLDHHKGFGPIKEQGSQFQNLELIKLLEFWKKNDRKKSALFIKE